MSVYVEILVRAPMDDLWSHTQTPALHERWDLRFSRIEYVPKTDDRGPQRFRYATRIGFGLEVRGEGETAGQRDMADGSSASALKFGSDEPISVIREGSGYWKYNPTPDGVRFLTSYDYRTRFGAAGALFDRLMFRPLIGWATAWSFDRLRLWLEKRVDPNLAVRQTLIHLAARGSLAVVFAADALTAGALTAPHAQGIIELALAAALLARWSRRWPAWLSLAAMPIATGIVAPLAAIDLLVLDAVPSAANCRRHPRTEEP
jgi:hypothetical protein